MSIIFLGAPNIALRKSIVILAVGPEPVSGEAGLYLADEEPSTLARISTRNPLQTIWTLTAYGDSFDLGGLALINHNLSSTGYFRLTTDAQTFVMLNPTALLTSNNITGIISNVDESPSSPDGLYISPLTTNLSWYVSFQFNQSGSFTARQGEAMAFFVAVVRYVGIAEPTYYPVIELELRENGILKRSLGKKAVTVTNNTDQIFIYPFNPSELTLSSLLDNVEARVLGYPGNSSYFKLESLTCIYDRGNDVLTFDSGWVKSVDFEFTSPRDGELPTKSTHFLFENMPTNEDVIKLMILDDGAELNPPNAAFYGAANSASAVAITNKPDQAVEVGEVIFGPLLEIDPGILSDSSQPRISVETSAAGGTNPIGYAYGADAFTKRGIPSSIELVCNRQQMMELMTKIGWQKGTSGLFYVILEPELERKYQLFTSFAAVCTEIQSYPLEIGKTGTTSEEDTYYVLIGLAEKQ